MGKYDTKRSSFETIGCYVASDILGYNNVLKQYLSLISLNTLALNYEARDLYTNQATLILQWLEYILSSSNANEVFIISMHIGPGTDISNGIKYQWKEEYQILFETIIQKYKAKILSLFTGHTHHFRMMLPLYSTTNKTKSVLGINLSSFSPIKSNNPTFYFASFANDTGSIQFSDLSIYEIELTQLITRQKSLLSIANSAVALTNSTLDVTKITWGDRFESVISLFKLPSDTDQSIVSSKQSWVSSFLLRMCGYDAASTYAQNAWQRRSDISLTTPYTSVTQRHQLYCSFITTTTAEFTTCMADTTWK